MTDQLRALIERRPVWRTLFGLRCLMGCCPHFIIPLTEAERLAGKFDELWIGCADCGKRTPLNKAALKARAGKGEG